ncbi:MAG: hypothetical protein Kow0089_07370 [Desulfobulbaceae bacterium]
MGFFMLHPVSMVVQGLVSPHYEIDLERLSAMFQPSHLGMALFFGILGTIFGTTILLLADSRSRMKRRVKILEKLLAICSYCHRIRDNVSDNPGERRWIEVEEYISSRAGVSFSHGICPECYDRFMKKLDRDFSRKAHTASRV